jgi:hypothetical protein
MLGMVRGLVQQACIFVGHTLQDAVQYLGVPAHIADANDSGRDIGPFGLRRGRIQRHGKRLAPVKDLDYPAVERPDLKATESGEGEVRQPYRKDERVFFRQQTRSRCTVLPSSLQD